MKKATSFFGYPFFFISVIIFFYDLLPVINQRIFSAENMDMSASAFYWRLYCFNKIRNFDFPLWNDSIFCGVTNIGNISSNMLYPLNCIFLIPDITLASNLSFITHFFIAGSGMIFFLRQLKLSFLSCAAGALAFTFSAPVVLQACSGHINILSVISWTGFIFGAAYKLYEKPDLISTVVLSLFISLAFLAGHFQVYFYIMIMLSIYIVLILFFGAHDKYRKYKVIIFYILAVVISVCLCAAQILPVIEFSSVSGRAKAPFEFCSEFSLPFEIL